MSFPLWRAELPVIPQISESMTVQLSPKKSVPDVEILGLSRSIMVYAITGAAGTSVYFLALIMLEPLAAPIVATTIGATCGAVTNHALARRFVFESSGCAARTLPRFMIVAVFGLITNGITMALLIQVLPLLVSQMFASSLVLFTGYTINRFWTFG